MKVTVQKALKTLRQINALAEHETKEGKMIESVKIPAEKSMTGFKIGQLSEELESIQKNYDKSEREIKKQWSTPATQKDKDGVEVKIPGQIFFNAEGLESYNTATNGILESEVDIVCAPFEYEMFDGIAWPATFWKEITVFLKEPK